MKSILVLILLLPCSLQAEIIGSVDTAFKLLGANHKIVIEAFDDPKVQGVSCHLSRAKTGGIKGSLGIAEDMSFSSISCRQVGPIGFNHKLKQGEVVFRKKTSLIFKKMRVARFYDQKRNTLIYLVYSDRLINGSPQNSVSTVPIMKWD